MSEDSPQQSQNNQAQEVRLSLEVVANIIAQVEEEVLVFELMRRHAERNGIKTMFNTEQLVTFIHHLVETDFACMACTNEGGENYLKPCIKLNESDEELAT